MARGKKLNTKSITEHKQDGTYAPSRHGLLTTKSDYDRIEEMKDTIFNEFNKLKTKLENTNIDTAADKYKMVSSILNEQIKTYISITRNKVINENAGEKEDGKIKME